MTVDFSTEQRETFRQKSPDLWHLLVKSCIKPSLLKMTLFKGTFIAATGVFLIAASGTLLPLFLLRVFGLPVLLMGVALIGFGLFPYRRLTKLELVPYEIGSTETMLLFLRNKKLFFKIPFESIEKIHYVDKEKSYGIAITLKRPLREKIVICDKSQDINSFLGQDESGDLFLPYFTKSAFEEVEDYIWG